MRKHPLAKCEKCPLAERPYVESYFPEDWNGTLFIGEAPGADEVRIGKPFVGQSGKLLRGIVEYLGVNPEECAYTNIVSCRPVANKTPKDQAVAACYSRLLKEVTSSPDLNTVVPLGKVACTNIVADYDYSSARGVPIYSDGVKIVPTWHPAYVLRRPKEYRTLEADLRKALTSHFLSTSMPEYEMILTAHDLYNVIRMYKDKEDVTCAWDLETDQTLWYDQIDRQHDAILLMTFSFNDSLAYIVPGGTPNQHQPYDAEWQDYAGYGPLYDNDMRDALDIFFNQRWTYSAHNGSFDMLHMTNLDVRATDTEDTILMHFVLCETSPHDLKSLATEYLGVPDYEKDLIQKYLSKRSDWYSKVPFEMLAQYAAWDAVITWKLHKLFRQLLIKEGLYEWPFKEVTQALLYPATELERKGFPVDTEQLNNVAMVFEDRKDVLQESMADMLDWPDYNPGSWQQNAKALWEILELPKNKGTRIYRQRPDSTSWPAIEHLSSINIKSGKKVRDGNEFVDKLVEWKSCSKRLSTYVYGIEKLVDTNFRVHPTSKIYGTEVTRRAVVRPPMQTIPRPDSDPFGFSKWLRSSFVASPGHVLVDVDYGAAELRIIAAESGDEFWLDVFERGLDPHGAVAAQSYGENYTKQQRVMAKMLNYADQYSGGNPLAVARDAGMPVSVIMEIFKQRKKIMPKYYEWMTEQFRKLKRDGYVQNRFGYKRRFPLITNQNVDDARKASVHAVTAGGAATITGLSWIDLWNQKVPIIHEMHDSLIAEVPEELGQEILELMSYTMMSVAEKWYPEVKWAVDGEVKTRWTKLPESL